MGIQLEIDFNEEEWRPVVGYVGLYEVSSLGRVRSVKHPVKRPFGDGFAGGKILKQSKGRVYYQVSLCKNNIKKTFRVHSLVAKAFIDNPLNLPCINHKDENPLNNTVGNLEFCTIKYNTNYGTSIERRALSHSKSPKLKAVKQTTIDGDVVNIWISSSEAARQLNCSQGNISNCCNGKKKTYLGFKWEYADNKKEIA